MIASGRDKVRDWVTACSLALAGGVMCGVAFHIVAQPESPDPAPAVVEPAPQGQPNAPDNDAAQQPATNIGQVRTDDRGGSNSGPGSQGDDSQRDDDSGKGNSGSGSGKGSSGGGSDDSSGSGSGKSGG